MKRVVIVLVLELVMIVGIYAVLMCTKPAPLVKYKRCVGYTVLNADSVITCHCDTIKYNHNGILINN